VVLVNRNRLVRTTAFVNGVKTGSTLEAGYILVASARRKGVELVSVVTGAPSEDARDEATLDLLDFGFSLYRKRTLVNAGEVVGRIELAGGNSMRVAAAESVTALARKDQRPVFDVRGGEGVDLPISQGQVIGEVAVALGGRRVGRVDAVATSDLEFASARSEDANLVLPILLSSAALALAVIGVQGARAVRRSR
jgi:D-alanyl-D-alanine carboxypeptidase (penicillin-binding protein 5/6)